ncbi:NAD(P)-dependent alcohol dehydrogenase [Pararhodobacter aggregans]|uniref:NAD(P)-dependent alcohol dehydrogenase n=1 Tax=Pararhodobacter aggregans TaxID=404875 RepID=UPI003A8E7FB2
MTIETMQAATARRYGGPKVMAIEVLPRPEPGPGQVLVKVAAFGVTRGDARIRGLDVPRGMGPMVRAFFGWTRPRRPVPGREFSGAISALGPGVSGWSEGEPVLGITDGMTMGAGAEYCVVTASRMLARRPATLTEAEAAALPFGLMTAADFLIDQMALQPGERLLVNGGSGAVGLAALWLGAHLGAEATGIASPANHAAMQDAGAHRTADYARPLPPGPYDAILDVAGTLPYAKAAPLLAPNGRLGIVTADLAGQIGAGLRSKRGGHRLCAGVIKETPAALNRVQALHAQGYRPAVTTLPLAEIVEAHRLASSGHKRGNVVVTL